MPNATVRANARTLPEATDYLDPRSAHSPPSSKPPCKRTKHFTMAAAQMTKPLRRPML